MAPDANLGRGDASLDMNMPACRTDAAWVRAETMSHTHTTLALNKHSPSEIDHRKIERTDVPSSLRTHKSDPNHTHQRKLNLLHSQRCLKPGYHCCPPKKKKKDAGNAIMLSHTQTLKGTPPPSRYTVACIIT